MAVYLGYDKVNVLGGQPVIVEGVDTSDATVTASDMAEGVKAYGADGTLVTGNVAAYDTQVGWSNRTPSLDTTGVMKLSISTTTPYLFRAGVFLSSPLSNFGDATAADVLSGKTFTSSSGLKVEGEASPGITVKTGTTTSTTISTGLDSVSYFMIYKTAVSATGLIQAIYNGSTTNMVYCSAYSSSTWGTKTYAVGTATPTISGGTITWNISSAASGGLSTSTTYNWIAFGS